jgi:hypothetical protein
LPKSIKYTLSAKELDVFKKKSRIIKISFFIF